MHWVFLHAHHVNTVHTAYLALSDSCWTTSTWFWGSKTVSTGITLDDGREWKCMHDTCISQSNSWLLCSILLLSVSLPLQSALFRYKQWSFKRRVVPIQCISAHLMIIEPCKGMRFSSSVWHLHNMHLSAPSPQIQIRTTNVSDGLLMVTQREGAWYIRYIFCTLHAYLRSAYACASII